MWPDPNLFDGSGPLRKWCRRTTKADAEARVAKLLREAAQRDIIHADPPFNTNYWEARLDWWLGTGGADFDDVFALIRRPNGTTITLTVITP